MKDAVLGSLLADVTRQHGSRASISAIAACQPALLAAYVSRQRVKVRNSRTGDVRTGIVSRSTGWTPVLLLIHRADTHGSSDTLNGTDEVIGWWDGRRYSDQPCPKAVSKHTERKKNR
jgi:hypothetical protein